MEKKKPLGTGKVAQNRALMRQHKKAQGDGEKNKNTVPFDLTFYGTNHNTFYKILLNEGVDAEHRYRGYDDNTVL